MNQSNPIDEALLLRYLLGKATSAEAEQVEEWLGQKESNRRQLDRLEAVWVESGRLSPPPVAVDVDAAWERLSRKMEAQPGKLDLHASRVKLVRMRAFRWTAGAAAVLLLGWLFWWLAGGPGTESAPLLTLQTGEGIATDTLSDGTTVSLNRLSSLTYPETFAPESRSVTLTGEAFFSVAPDPQAPFTVNLDRAGVRVVGTSFNVSAYPSRDIEVLVISGTVLLFRPDPDTGDTASILLTAGMKGILAAGPRNPGVVSGPVADDLFWLDQQLEFRQTPLEEVIRTLERNYPIRIRLSDPEARSCRLTATFRGESPELILQVIADTFSLTLEQEDNTYVLYGTGCTGDGP